MFDDSSAWAIPQEQSSGDIVKDAIEKDKVVKQIIAAQEGLRAMLSKVHDVQADIDKLGSENATLQMYIDNLTKQLAKRR